MANTGTFSDAVKARMRAPPGWSMDWLRWWTDLSLRLFPDEDPDLPFPADATGMHDPYPGDEFAEQAEFDGQFGLGVDPTDYDRGFAVRYAQGVDEVCLTNGPVWRAVGRLGHIEEVRQRALTGAIWGQRCWYGPDCDHANWHDCGEGAGGIEVAF
jgi:hypothetical protein